MGLIFTLFVIYIIWKIIKSFLNSHVRLLNTQRLLADRLLNYDEYIPPYPSWSNNSRKRQEFIVSLIRLSNSRNIPQHFVITLINNSESFEKILLIASAMEQSGASINNQIIAVVDYLEVAWEKYKLQKY